MRTYRISCECSQSIEFGEEYIGQDYICPSCSRICVLRVPESQFKKFAQKTLALSLGTLKGAGKVFAFIVGVLLRAIAQLIEMLVALTGWCVKHYLGLVGLAFIVVTIGLTLESAVLTAGLQVTSGFGFGFVLIGMDTIINRMK